MRQRAMWRLAAALLSLSLALGGLAAGRAADATPAVQVADPGDGSGHGG